MEKRILAVRTAWILALLFAVQSVLCVPVRAADAYPLYTLVTGETDADGNILHDYSLDENGRVVYPEFGAVSAAAQEDVPESFDGRQYDYLTAVKNQGGSGSCWVFSTVSCMETSFIKQGYGTAENTDFSESHLTWFSYRRDDRDPSDSVYGDGRHAANPYRVGGNWTLAAATAMSGVGMQLEENAPWTLSWDGDELLSGMTLSEQDRYVSHARMVSAIQVANSGNRDALKKIVMQYGSAGVSYYDDTGIDGVVDYGFNKQNNCYYQTGKTGVTNHMVTVVGWDDNFPRGSFNDYNQPDGDGAWLVKGSWGSKYGDGGYYWISYEEPTLSSFTAYEAAPADTFEHIYQYDGTYTTKYFTLTNVPTASIANTFTAQRDELLTHVAYFNQNVGATVTAEVYVGDTKPTLVNNNPTLGLTKIETATTSMDNAQYGYSTMKLASPVPLSEGQYFTVKITFTTTNGKTYIPVEGLTVENPADGKNSYGGNTGESFFCAQNTWYDTGKYGDSDLNNVPVKAMTTSLEPTLSIAQYPDKTEFYLGETPSLNGLKLAYTDGKGETTVLTSGFAAELPTMNTAGTYTITVKYAGLSCTFDVTARPRPGDVDQSGDVNLTDVALIVRSIAGGYDEPLDEAGIQLADVNADGTVNLMDVALLKRYLVGGYGVEL